MNNLIIGLFLVSSNMTIAPGKSSPKQDLLNEIKQTCEIQQPKEFCDCVYRLTDKNIKEEDMKKIVESNDPQLLKALGLTMRMIALDCAHQYEEMQRKQK